jgi:hypothetical protein
MINSELIHELQQYPLDLEVYIEGEAPRDKPVTSVDWNVAGQHTWLTLSDFPAEK